MGQTGAARLGRPVGHLLSIARHSVAERSEESSMGLPAGNSETSAPR